MAKTRSYVRDSQGMIKYDGAQTWDFIYSQTSAKDARFNYGDTFTLPDGRVFKYGNTVGACLSGFGASNASGTVNMSVAMPGSIVAGDRTATITVASGDGYAADGLVAKDELAGGYFVTGHGASTVQNRQIIANAAVASGGGTCLVTVDGPFSNALTTPFTEVVLNPYRYLIRGVGAASTEYHAVMGVPALNVTSTYKAWFQSWGPCWVTPGGDDATPGSSQDDRMAYFVGDGSVNFGTFILSEARGHQTAGFCIDQTSGSATALPLIMLQISI